jgi:hypothetical protein
MSLFSPFPPPPHIPLCPSRASLNVQYTIRTRNLATDSLGANPNPWLYIIGTTGASGVSGGTVDGPYYLSVPLVDFVSPGSNPSSLAFADTEPGASLVAGTLTIGLPAPGRVPPIARCVLVCVTVVRVRVEGV